MQTAIVPIAESRTEVGRPEIAIWALTARRAIRSGAGWGYVFGIFVASTALGYAATYKTLAQRAQLAKTFTTNAGIDAIIGRAHDVQTVAGFTAWRSLGVLSIVGAVWGLLAGTRLLRGEEEAGRWELLLSGPTTRARAAAQAVAGLASGGVVLFALTAAITAATGHSSKVALSVPRSLFLALALVCGAVVFLALGALMSQLAATRRRAATYGGVLIGTSFVLRVIADSGSGLGWLRWTTPLGWVEQLNPVAHPTPLALLPIAGLSVGAAAGTVWLAAQRDLGASIFADRVERPPRTLLLGGPGRLAVRLAAPSVVGWLAGSAVFALGMGFIAKAAAGAVAASATARQAFARLGAAGAGSRVFLAATLLIASLLVCLCAASQIVAVRGAEAEGQAEGLLVRPVPRSRWLGQAVGVATAGLLACGVGVAACAWAGASIQHTGIAFSTLLQTGLNLTVPALCVLGVGVLALGVRPRATTAVAYGLLAWGFLIDFIGSVAGLNHWLLDTSLFHQIAAAPAEPVQWRTDGVLVALAAAASAIGLIAFRSRDLQGL